MILHGVFSGTGATRLSCMVNCLCMWALYVPLAFMLARVLEWGPAGVFSAMALGHYASFVWTVRAVQGNRMAWIRDAEETGVTLRREAPHPGRERTETRERLIKNSLVV